MAKPVNSWPGSKKEKKEEAVVPSVSLLLSLFLAVLVLKLRALCFLGKYH
jgi:hypothetical protein